jgi:amino acid transporter
MLAGPAGAAIITVTALVSIGANLFAQFITTPRLTFALAQADILPRWFGAVHRRFATPANSVIALGVITGALAISGAFVWLAVISTLARLMVYLLCAGALASLKRREPVAKALLGWLAITLSLVVCAWAAVQADQRAWLLLAAFALAGTGLYAFARWRRRKSGTSEL